MKRAIWKDTVIAESDDIVTVEGNAYFPKMSLNKAHLEESSTRTTCPWKGEAHYYTVSVDGAKNPDAAWYYPDPKPAAAQISDRVAFWKGVQIVAD